MHRRCRCLQAGAAAGSASGVALHSCFASSHDLNTRRFLCSCRQPCSKRAATARRPPAAAPHPRQQPAATRQQPTRRVRRRRRRLRPRRRRPPGRRTAACARSTGCPCPAGSWLHPSSSASLSAWQRRSRRCRAWQRPTLMRAWSWRCGWASIRGAETRRVAASGGWLRLLGACGRPGQGLGLRHRAGRAGGALRHMTLCKPAAGTRQLWMLLPTLLPPAAGLTPAPPLLAAPWPATRADGARRHVAAARHRPRRARLRVCERRRGAAGARRR